MKTGPAPRGAFLGRVPPNDCLCPEEINRLGAGGVQIEALDSQNRAYCPRIREQELIFRNVCGLAPDFIKLRVYFGTKTFSVFFLVFTLEFVENRKMFEMKTRIVEICELRPFFFSSL